MNTLEKNPLMTKVENLLKSAQTVTSQTSDDLITQTMLAVKEVKKENTGGIINRQKADWLSSMNVMLVETFMTVAEKQPELSNDVLNKICQMNILNQTTNDPILLRSFLDAYQKMSIPEGKKADLIHVLQGTRNLMNLHKRAAVEFVNDLCQDVSTDSPHVDKIVYALNCFVKAICKSDLVKVKKEILKTCEHLDRLDTGKKELGQAVREYLKDKKDPYERAACRDVLPKGHNELYLFDEGGYTSITSAGTVFHGKRRKSY